VIRKVLMVLIPLGLLAGGAVATRQIMNSRVEPERVVREVEPPLVEVIEVQPRQVHLTVKAEGTVSPLTEAELVPEVSGRVVEMSPAMVSGGYFKKGDVLIKVDTREYELALTRSRSAIEQAKLRLAIEHREAELAEREWESLSEGKPPTDLALRKPYIAEAEAAVEAAQSDLERAEYDLERCVVRASFDGRVRTERVDIGQFISRGSSLATLYSVDAAEIRLPIPDDQVAYIDLPFAYSDDAPSEGQGGPRVKVRSDFAGQIHEWDGRIVRTEGEIDPRTRMVFAIARVERPYARGASGKRPPLAVGMFVEAEIEGVASGYVVELPRNIFRGEDILLVVDEQDQLTFRKVDVLRQEGETVLVRAGLEAGERVCSSAMETPIEGMKVRVVVRSEGDAGGTT